MIVSTTFRGRVCRAGEPFGQGGIWVVGERIGAGIAKSFRPRAHVSAAANTKPQCPSPARKKARQLA